MFIFRIYASFDSSYRSGFEVVLTAPNEKDAISKVETIVLADKLAIREIIQMDLWERGWK
jgi:hypothetical protein